MFKLILNQDKIVYGQQDKVNMMMKVKPELSLLRHNIDDIKYEVMKIHKTRPELSVIFVGV